MKVGDLVKLKEFFGHAMNRTSCGTVIAVDEEGTVTVQWWDDTVFIPNPSMEKSTNLVVICEEGE
jgi:hypothetical protein|tara:strand:- start:337 stop:531 length:195 start_codon:yes stop_codon:yes gene_type:complete